MDQREYLCLNSLRRFGAEIEINSSDMRNRPIGWEDGKLPEGIHYVGNLVKKITEENVLIHKWGNDHHNDCWIVKPDSSCGIEVCTPVFKGWHGIMQTCRVVDGFNKDSKISADHRCSYHVHVDVSDLADAQLDRLASVISWWIKCEAVFMDAMPSARKRNQYCQFLGMTDIFDDIDDGLMSHESLFKRVGHCKYYSLNTFHYVQKKRKTIEFRIMDNNACRDAWTVKNWTRLILHFVERAVKRGMPKEYNFGDQWSGYAWLDPVDVFSFLGFAPDEYDLSPGLQQVRHWFLRRLLQYSKNTGLEGVMSDRGRSVAQAQIAQLAADMGIDADIFVPTDEDVYSEKFRI